MDDDEIDYGISVLLQENATLKRQLADVTAKRDALMDCFFEFETIAPNGELMASVLDMHKRLESLESQLSEAQARLAGYEVGFDPATNPPDDSAYVFVKTNDGRQYYAVYDCPSDDSIARFIVLPFEEFTPIFSINNIARWFPLPGAAFSELAKGAE